MKNNVTPSAARIAFLFVIAGALLPACGGGGGSGGSSQISQAPPQPVLNQAIQHVFVILKGSHSFDSLFRSYPNQSPSIEVSMAEGADFLVEPGSDHWSTGDPSTADSWDSARAQWNGGAMDGFVAVPGGMSGPFASTGITNEAGRRRTPYYWFLADQGVLSDHFFSFQFGPALPNMVGILAASSAGMISDPSVGATVVLDPSTGVRSTITDITSAMIPTALPNLLEKAGLTWTAFQEGSSGVDLVGALASMDVVRSLPDFNQRAIRDPNLAQSLGQYLAAGWAGNVTFIKPADANNELPVLTELRSSEEWTQAIVDAIGNSPLWSSSVIFIVWDSAGGYYDGAPPPQMDAFGTGFRVPCLVVSPFAKKGVIQSTPREHSSITKFCESTFGLPTMTARDAAADSLADAFDFSQAPRPYSDFSFPPRAPDPAVLTFPSEGRVHVAVGTVVDYQTDPPTSGNHYPDPQPGGFSSQPVAAEFLVHAMEHGGVIIYYDPTVITPDQQGALTTLANQHLGIQSQVCVAPRSDTTHPITLTAWTHMLQLAAYDAGSIQGFLNAFLGRGPE